MEPLYVIIFGPAVAAMAAVVTGTIRWKRSFASHPAGWRHWFPLTSLGLSTIVMVAFILMLVRARFVDFYSRGDEYFLWLRAMLAVSLLAMIAAGVGRGAGRILSLLAAVLLFEFIFVVSRFPQ